MYGCIPVTVVWMKQDKQHLRTQIDNLQRAHSILTKLVGYSKEEIIFDLNTSSRPEHV